jgi:hypothetical protein
VFDSEDGELADPALQLSAAGFNVLYANHLDELLLTSREYADRAGAILAPVPMLLDELPELLKRVVFPINLAASAVMPVGERPAMEALDSLRIQGLRWALWKPFHASELRFGVGLALQTNDPGDPRRDLRVPCSRPVVLETAGRERAVVLRDVSASGALLAFADTLKPDDPCVLRLRLAGGELRLPGRVAWSSADRSQGPGVGGIGIHFDSLDEKPAEALRSFVGERIDSFRI